MRPGRFDTPVTILVNAPTRDARYKTRVNAWTDGPTVLAEVEDILPSRADRVGDEISLTRRPARVRMHFRTDVSQANRLRIRGREMRIVSGPAELGRRQGLEFMVEESSTEGEEP